MNRSILLVAAILVMAPAALAHNPPGIVTTCQDVSSGDGQYHDYLPANDGHLILAGDGNLEDCGPNNWTVGPWLDDNDADCQTLKSDPAFEQAHTVLCTEVDTGVSQDAFDYDNEYDYGHGGVFLAVNSGDGATWGSVVCYGMEGHHSHRIYAEDWLSGHGPAITGTADHSRTPPAAGPKGTPADCGDSIVEPCDATPPAPSTSPFPLNVVIDEVQLLLWQVFEDPGTTCNASDCAEFGAFASGAPSHLEISCPAGIDGIYAVFIEPDFDQPDLPQLGHVWTY